MISYLGGSQGVSDASKKVVDFLNSGSIVAQVLLSIIIIMIIIFIYKFIRGIIERTTLWRQSRIPINNGETICPKTSLIIPGSRFHKSKNELGGVEFSWAFWMYIEDWSFKYGQWKHILHKGNSSSWPNRGPGIWLHPKENIMRFYMNTYDSIAGNYIDIPSIPVKKWFHVVFSVNQITMDVHINGTLRKSLKLSSLPKQNFGDVFVMAFRGFDGYLSRLTYYNYLIPYSEIDGLVSQGPAKVDCQDKQLKKEIPPYLTPNWWINTYQSGNPEFA